MQNFNQLVLNHGFEFRIFKHPRQEFLCVSFLKPDQLEVFKAAVEEKSGFVMDYLHQANKWMPITFAHDLDEACKEIKAIISLQEFKDELEMQQWANAISELTTHLSQKCAERDELKSARMILKLPNQNWRESTFIDEHYFDSAMLLYKRIIRKD